MFEAVNELRCLFVDFNAFFAAVAQHDEPELFGRPVIVIPTESKHTSAIAASYEAKAFGINRGTKVWEAKDLCPEVVIRPARHDRYVELHKVLMAVIDDVIPIQKVCSIDEAAFRLPPSARTRERARDLGEKVAAAIKDKVGRAFRCSIGVGQNRLLAKLGAGMIKPDGLTILCPEDLPGMLADVPLGKFPGIGPRMEARLAKAGINDLTTLWNIEPKHARRLWGSVQGERFWYALHGYVVADVATKTSMIGHSRVLIGDHQQPDKAKMVARALLLKAASRLRQADKLARRLSITVKIHPTDLWEGHTGVELTQDSFAFLKALEKQWDRFEYHWRTTLEENRLSSVSIYLHGLADRGSVAERQGDLFMAAADREKQARRARLWSVIDEMNIDEEGRLARLGGGPKAAGKLGDTKPRHVMLASQRDLSLEYLGAKIAFARVPDEKEFLM